MDNEMLSTLADRRFPAGLRELPANDSPRNEAAKWVSQHIDAALGFKTQQMVDPDNELHRPRTWEDFEAILDRSGEDGMVLVPSSRGRDAEVFMRNAGQIWRFSTGPNGPVAELWTVPSPLSGALPPQMALAFNHCADPIPPSTATR
jgi:hypothetical protein